MEKFSVDLEKVLDEFEFNEEREEQDTPPSIKHQPLPHLGLCQIPPSRPPAASYRRPSFEPINLSEADFAASPPSITPAHFNNDILNKQNLNRTSSIILQNGTRNKNFLAPSSSRSALDTNSIVNIKDVDIVETDQEIRSDEDSWSRGESPSSTDEKPDLLEYKPNDYLKDVILPAQLPDVTTSVWSLPIGISSSLEKPLNNAPLCDLIHSSNGNFYDNVKHNVLLENISNIVSDNYTNLQLNSNAGNDFLERTDEDIRGSDCSNIHPNILSDAVKDHLKLTQGGEHTLQKELLNKILTKPSETFCDKRDGDFSQGPSFEDTCKSPDKEDANDHKQEISGSLNTLHQTSSCDVYEDDVNRLKPDYTEPSKSYLNMESGNMNTEIDNFQSNNNLDEVNTNHDRKVDLLENESTAITPTDQYKIVVTEFNKSNNTAADSLEIMSIATNQASPVIENNQYNHNKDIKPIGFTSNNNVTDSELQQYLDELENTHDDELCLNTEQPKFSKDKLFNETNVLPVMTRNIIKSDSFSETNSFPNKLCNLSENKKGFGKKSNNTNKKDKNLDLSIQLSDHISDVEFVSQDSCKVINPKPSSLLVNVDNTVLRAFENEKEDHSQLIMTENIEECEKDLATGQILKDTTSSMNDKTRIQNAIQVTKEDIAEENMDENFENNNSCIENISESTEELNSKMDEVKTQTLDRPPTTNVVSNISEGSIQTEKDADNYLIKCSNPFNESLNQLEISSDVGLADPKDDVNSELSITEDISGDSENSSNGYVQKVIKCIQEFADEGVQNSLDCDSLMSQESLEEDSFNKPLTNTNNILDSPSPSLNNEYDCVTNVSAKMIPIKTAIACTSQAGVDEAGVPAEEDKPSRPNSLELPARIIVDTEEPTVMPLSPTTSGELELSPDERRLGKVAPIWVPDSDAPACMQCQVRFTVIKRRHHCRACGQVLCSKCCGLKARLEFCGYSEARVCQPCFSVLETVNGTDPRSPLGRQPNPNNPMEYCSTIPPLQQVAGSLHQPPPSVMVPVGVLKREGRSKSEVAKQVMFSDGIRPGGDLTELDGSGEPRLPFRRPGRQTKRVGTPPGGPVSSSSRRALDPITQSFIPKDGDMFLPPIVTCSQGELIYTDREQPITLNEGPFKFAVNRNLNVHIKRVLLDCCVNRECWCISSDGLSCVGQDEVVLLLECLPQETLPPKDVFLLINSLYQNAAKGTTVSEMSFTPASSNKLLGSRDHGGFLYIRPSYQCTAQLILPPPPYLFALLIHRWETPWARLFPIRLVLRLGAEFRYYPCPLVSVRLRGPLYTDIGHTIINLLADFRKYSYTLPTVRGLVIHMEDRQTSILLPRNRYDQVIRALNNSNDSVLAFGANFSLAADSHLVCMQSIEDESTSYHTQAINIHNKPRRVTGASFVVFNGALKTPGLAGKSNIVEDGLMVQVPSETMIALRAALRDMHDYTIGCGPHAEETVLLQWTADDINFNVGVKSCIDGRPLDGVPSIRVHSGTDYTGGSRLIRWTEVFILQQSEEGTDHTGEPLDISRLSGSIAQATCLALVPLLDLLSAASLTTLAVRANIHPEKVGYEAGGNGEKLPPFYMKSLDDELVAVVHQAALAAENTPATLELVFRIMEQG